MVASRVGVQGRRLYFTCRGTASGVPCDQWAGRLYLAGADFPLPPLSWPGPREPARRRSLASRANGREIRGADRRGPRRRAGVLARHGEARISPLGDARPSGRPARQRRPLPRMRPTGHREVGNARCWEDYRHRRPHLRIDDDIMRHVPVGRKPGPSIPKARVRHVDPVDENCHCGRPIDSRGNHAEKGVPFRWMMAPCSADNSSNPTPRTVAGARWVVRIITVFRGCELFTLVANPVSFPKASGICAPSEGNPQFGGFPPSARGSPPLWAGSLIHRIRGYPCG